MAESKIESRMDLLWTNPSPNSDFSGQTINLDLSKYTRVLISFVEYAPDTNRHNAVNVETPIGIISNISNYFAFQPYVSENKVSTFCGRGFNLTATGINFGAGINQVGVNAGQCVPIKIYGIK